MIAAKGVQFLEALADTQTLLTHRTQFHVTLYARARVRASRKVTSSCVRCVSRCSSAGGPISAIQAANRPQTRTSIGFSSLAVFSATGVQTCKPGTHPGSHLHHSPISRTRLHRRLIQPIDPRTRVRTANPANLVFRSDGGAMLRSRPPHWNIARKDPFCLGHMCVRQP